MTNEQLDSLIDSVNDGTAVDRVFHWPLAGNVHEARVWLEYPTGRFWNEEGYKCFFIYVDGVCVGVIFDMGPNDFHAYVKIDYRKRGFTCNALRNIVLPYWRSQGRMEQRTQYQTDEAYRLLVGLGARFEVDERGRNIAVISLDQFAGIVIPPPVRPSLSVDRSTAIRDRLNAAYGLIVRAQSKCDSAYVGRALERANREFESLKDAFCTLEAYEVDNDEDLLRRLGYTFDDQGNASNTFDQSEGAANAIAARSDIPLDHREAFNMLILMAHGLLQMVKEEVFGSTGEEGDNGFFGLVEFVQSELGTLYNP